MNKFFGSKFFKTSLVAAGITAACLTLVFVAVPRKIDKAAADEGCNPVYENPIFNPYPVTWNDYAGTDCTDFAVLSAGKTSDAHWSNNLSANVGDEIRLRVYAHNGARSGSNAVIYGARYNVQMDSASGYISATLSADNAQAKSSSVNINLPAGARLELVAGSLDGYIGDLLPCFNYSEAHYLTVRVVSQAVPEASINSSLGSKVSGQCLWYGNVTWSSQNVNNVQVFVRDNNTGTETLMAAWEDGNTTVDWIGPENSYTFILRGDGISERSSNLENPNSCQTQQPQQLASGSLTLSHQNSCDTYGSVSWQTSYAKDRIVVTVRDLTDNTGETIVGAWDSGYQSVDYLERGHTYRFALYEDYDNSRRLLDSEDLSVSNNCGTVNPVLSGTGSISIGHQNTCDTTGSVSWQSANTQDRVVITVRDLTTSSNENIVGAWMSGYQWVDYLERGHTYRFALYEDYDGAKRLLDSQEVSVSANCGQTAPLTCSPSNTTAEINQNVTFSASGGKGVNDYLWQQNGVSFAQAYGTVYRSFASAGSYNISVTDGNQTASCNVTVRQPEQPVSNPPVCVLTSASNITGSASASSDLASYSVSGGNGSFVWSAVSGSPFAGQGNNFSTRFNAGITTGLVSVSSNGQVANCPPVNIIIPQQPQQLICLANPNQANVNKSVTFSVSGGNGSYAWSNASGNPSSPVPTGNTGSYSTSYTTSGNKTVQVTSGSQTVSCNVQINQPQQQNLTCSPSASSINLGQPVVYTAAGGNGVYSWSTSGASSAVPSVTGNSYSVTYSSAGSKNATVTSGSQTAQCGVYVNEPQTQSGLVNISKEVRNINNNEDFRKITTARNGDILEYKISVWAGSSVVLNNVRVTDFAQSGLNYVSGSLTVDGVSHAPGLSSGGLVFNNVGTSKLAIVYRMTVSANSGSIQNTATATAGNATNTATDQALVNISTVVQGQPALSIVKQVKNLGPSQTTSYASVVNAKRGDSVQYEIVIRNTGTASAENVYVSDSQPLTAGNLSVSKSYTGSWPNISLGSLPAGQSVTITYTSSINQDSGSIWNTASVSASNSATQNSTARVDISAQGGSSGGSIIFNSCINYSCNTNITNTNTYYYYSSNSTPIQANDYRQLSIQKLVRSVNGGTFQNSVSVNYNDTVEFEITVTNTGNQPVNNVQLQDSNVSGLQWTGSTYVDGSGSSYWNGSNLYLGTLYTGQSKRVTFQARVVSSNNSSIQNIASVSGDGVPYRQDDAWVFVNSGSVAGGNVSLTYNKRAWNDSKNADATSQYASKEDYITYTLTVTNNGNQPATNFVITDDLSQVLPYADMVDNGGGWVSGNVLSYQGLTIPAGGSVSKSFRVRIKYFLSSNLSYVMTNTYGNTVTVNINTPQVKGAFIAPKTGADTNAFVFAGLAVAVFGAFRKRKFLGQLIFS